MGKGCWKFMSLFDFMLRNYFDEKMFEKFLKVKIFIIGCGGFGFNIVVLLVRCGVKNFIIVDFDKVDILNFNR